MKPIVALPTRRLAFSGAPDLERELEREWLVTNGLGGYASGTLANVPTRRYHGLLIAALPAPFGRTVMLNHLAEQVRLPNDKRLRLGGLETVRGGLSQCGLECLAEFRLEGGLPVWRFQMDDHVVEKRVVMPHEQNSVHVSYRLIRGQGPVRIKLRPSINIRMQEEPVDSPARESAGVHILRDRYDVLPPPDSGLPSLRMYLHGAERAFTMEPLDLFDIRYRVEERRGYAFQGSLWSPGYFRASLQKDREVTFVASTEDWETLLVLSPEQAMEADRERRERLLEAADKRLLGRRMAQELVLAADQFIVKPVGRAEEHARARAVGDEVRTIIAGYHWFNDWGRDTMISLEGLTLVTGRHAEAGFILRTFAQYVRDGLIPNLFPEGEREGLYHTADATLWFFEALHRYLQYTSDRRTLNQLRPVLCGIYEAHRKGTHFGIGVDPDDGLLAQGKEGYQLTWMDAKVGEWVVTPRRGKTVEINALWYNALRLLSGWLAEENPQLAQRVASDAERARVSFNRRFWCAAENRLYDGIDGPGGDDGRCRPNQILAVSLPFEVLDHERWEPVFRNVEEELLTPVGLRTLARSDPDYKRQYFGDLRARDAAYHQGTVWAWLVGPFVDALIKVHPERRPEVGRLLEAFDAHLNIGCVGSINEIFDAEPPFSPRGCIAQAWSVAEILRCHLMAVAEPDDEHPPGNTGDAWVRDSPPGQTGSLPNSPSSDRRAS